MVTFFNKTRDTQTLTVNCKYVLAIPSLCKTDLNEELGTSITVATIEWEGQQYKGEITDDVTICYGNQSIIPNGNYYAFDGLGTYQIKPKVPLAVSGSGWSINIIVILFIIFATLIILEFILIYKNIS